MAPQNRDSTVDQAAERARRETFVDLLMQMKGAQMRVDATAGTAFKTTCERKGLISECAHKLGSQSRGMELGSQNRGMGRHIRVV